MQEKYSKNCPGIAKSRKAYQRHLEKSKQTKTDKTQTTDQS